MAQREKSKSWATQLEKKVRSLSSKVVKPKTGVGSGSGRKQGVGKAAFDNSASMYKPRKKSQG